MLQNTQNNYNMGTNRPIAYNYNTPTNNYYALPNNNYTFNTQDQIITSLTHSAPLLDPMVIGRADLRNNCHKTRAICLVILLQNIIFLIVSFVYKYYQNQFFVGVMSLAGAEALAYAALLISTRYGQASSCQLRLAKIIMSVIGILIFLFFILLTVIVFAFGFFKGFFTFIIVILASVALVPRLLVFCYASCGAGYKDRPYYRNI